MTIEQKVKQAEQIVAIFKCFASAKSDPNDPIPTTEEGMVKEIMSEFGFGLLEAIDIVKRVEVI